MKKVIWIVEDDKDIRFLLTHTLAKAGYEVHVFSEGYSLLAKGGPWPALFLLDVELPGINGLEICKWLKQQEETMYIPVLFVSGSAELKVLAENVRSDGYLAKPVSTNVLLEKVEHLVQSNPVLV
jgi:DNA-binding response OmpR family regulator